jgi:hypothetical protein
MMDNGFYTYLWLREDGTPYYVGKGRGKRAFRCGAPPAERVIIQYHPSERDALVAEVFFIAYYGRKDLGTGCLRNYTDGGGGVSGWICSAEARAKMSASKMNHATSDETRAKLSASRRGKVASDETRAKMSASRRGKVASDETREKMSASKMNHAESDETRAKISANHVGMKGKVHSDETKAKIRLSRLACIEKRKREE